MDPPNYSCGTKKVAPSGSVGARKVNACSEKELNI